MPKNRRYSITASEEDTIPVLAMFDKKAGPKKTYLSILACNDCNTQVLANNFIIPCCPCCASDNITPTSDKLMEHTSKEIADMKPLAHCTKCDMIIASPKESLASLDDNKLYCLSCSSLASAITAADDDDDDDDDKDDTSTDDMSDTMDEDTDELFNNDAGEGDDSSNDDTSTDDNSSGDDNSSSDDSGDDNSGADDDSSNSDTSNSDDSSTDSNSGTSLNANLVKAMSGKQGSTSVVASPDRSKWFLFVDNMPVATASKEAASDNVQAMFGTDKFATAWQAATSDGVTEDVLGDFGFTAINTSVPVDEAVKQTVEAAIEENTKKYRLSAKDIAERYQRCAGIASVGINKNVFKEENPVKTAIIASLKSQRIRNPEGLVNAAWEQHGEQYLKNISIKASELMDKGEETLDELADTVNEAKYTKTETIVKEKPSVVSLFKPKDEEENEGKETKEIAASDDADDPYANILKGANFRS